MLVEDGVADASPIPNNSSVSRSNSHEPAKERRREHQLKPTMDTVNYVVYLLALIALFGGVVVWAFGRKRKKRFEEDAKMPFRE